MGGWSNEWSVLIRQTGSQEATISSCLVQ